MSKENNQLVVKEVDFQGATLLGVQTEDGKIWAGVRWMCEGIGFSEKQKDRQVSNIQNDLVLKKGSKKLSLKFGGQVREVLVLELDFLPLWLAKISITPAMQETHASVVERLVEYQLKAKDVLAREFVHSPIQEYLTWDEDERAIAYFNERKQKKILEQQIQIQAPKISYYDLILQSSSLIATTDIAKDYGLTAQKLNKILMTAKIQYKRGKKWYLYDDYAKQGLAQSTTELIETESVSFASQHLKWTQTGRVFIHNLLKDLGISPIVDQEFKEAR
ncbi:phage antirepressor KilAC domain-containing protein [Paenibacillus elgii]|uniref:phage antirepressor KilAC domain-containing protein n=1 Tax=Paenibacillus elgii TaxID=189691 RepID=UPI000248D267|nr:phage antirepressor KilAC domain-containing protein [Paenibacillus elgii]